MLRLANIVCQKSVSFTMVSGYATDDVPMAPSDKIPAPRVRVVSFSLLLYDAVPFRVLIVRLVYFSWFSEPPAFLGINVFEEVV